MNRFIGSDQFLNILQDGAKIEQTDNRKPRSNFRNSPYLLLTRKKFYYAPLKPMRDFEKVRKIKPKIAAKFARNR